MKPGNRHGRQSSRAGTARSGVGQVRPRDGYSTEAENDGRISTGTDFLNEESFIETVRKRFGIKDRRLTILDSSYPVAWGDAYTLVKGKKKYYIIKDCLESLGIHHFDEYDTLDDAERDYIDLVKADSLYRKETELNDGNHAGDGLLHGKFEGSGPRDFYEQIDAYYGISDMKESFESDVFYHFTTNLPAVLSEGLKSRTETGTSALGGGSGKTVSITWNRGRADEINQQLRTAIRIARGEMNTDEFIKLVESRNVFQDNDSEMEVYHRLTEIPFETIKDAEDDIVKAWFEENYERMDGRERLDLYTEFMKILQDVAREHTSEFGGAWEEEMMDVGILTGYDSLIELEPEKFGIVEVKIRPDLILADPDHDRLIIDEEEVRVYPREITGIREAEHSADGTDGEIIAF